MVLGAVVAVLAYAACSSSTSPKAGSVASIVVTPDSLGLSIGASNTLHAVAQDAQSKTVGGTTFFWSTSDANVVSVSQSGEITALQAGTAQIGASTDGKTGFARVTVGAALVHSVTVTPARDTIFATAPSNTVMLVATSFDADGHELAGRPVTWSTNSSLVSVTNGLVTATDAAAGSATVTATSSDPGSPSGSATIVVIGHVATVMVSPANTTLSASGGLFADTVQLTAQLIDTFNTDVSGQRTVTWSSNNPSVATVNSSTGLVTAVADVGSGKATITATTADGATGTSKVSVLP
jgi:uncharacterized protein YjdB